MPYVFGVVLFVYLPVDWRSSVDTPIKEAFRQTTEAVIDELAWLATNIDDPVEVFQHHKAGIQIDTAVLAY